MSHVATWLQGNPIARQPTYRREVLSALPQLRRLDDADVTSAERLAVQLQLTEETDDDDDNDVEEGDDEREDDAPPVTTTDAAVSPFPSTSAQLLTPDSLSRYHYHPLSVPQRASSPAPAVSRVMDDAPAQEPPASHQQLIDSLRVDVATGAMTPTARTTRAQEVATPARPGAAISSHPLQAAGQAAPVSDHSQLLQHRVGALESVLAIQDKAIQQGLVHVGRAHAASGDGATAATAEDAAQLYAQLLNSWRAKVVALMVQMQSMELTRSDDTRGSRLRAEELEAVRIRLEQECELWQQKYADATAQRDLERLRSQESQARCAAADHKVVSAVRTLSVERERLQEVASAVAFFSAVRAVLLRCSVTKN